MFFAVFQSYSIDNDPARYTQNSVLSQGKWYKIKIPETGVYKLTYKDLKKLGLSNPQNVKIYGYGGWMLEENFLEKYVDDLPEVSIWMNKDQSEFRNDDDYILFYGRGDIKWTYNASSKEFEQKQNPYSADNYYYVTEIETPSKLMEKKNSFVSGGNVINVYNDYVLHEKELVNPGETGREFYGENFLKSPSVNVVLETQGATSDPGLLHYDFISKSSISSGLFTVNVNGQDTQVYTYPSNDQYTIALASNDVIEVPELTDKNTINVTYKKGGTSDKNVYLNYIRLNFKRHLKPYNAVTSFRSTDLSPNLTFNISDATSSLLILDVTDHVSPQLQNSSLDGSTMSFSADNSSIKEYVMVDLSKINKIPTPSYEGVGLGQINNQNLHALEPAEMIIIVNDHLKSYAKELADLHHSESGLTSLLVSPQDIYNEFSSGKPDATAYRRFMKMFYDRAQGGDNYPKYLLLFGGGTYDNRLIQNWSDEAKQSMLLTYQSYNSLYEIGSYLTDDYFGFLDDDSSPYSASENDLSLSNSKLKLGIGRLPVRSQAEAVNIVSKIREYMNGDNDGIWQNIVTFVADDAIAGTNDINEERKHMVNAEELSDYISQNNPDFIIKKVYEDMYERVIESNGARYPDAKNALLDRINNGTLFLNFIGHGAATSWTHEYLLTMPDIESMNNDKLALWITATCDFSRFDANSSSGGEVALLKEYGGAIALFSTVRVVYTGQNQKMNTSVTKYILNSQKGTKPRLGDIMRNAKNDDLLNNDSNKLRFLLLGDPALQLAYPEPRYHVEVTEMNNRNSDADDINIQALDDVLIKGIVADQNGNIVSDFNGTLQSMIFDAQQTLHTRGNKNNGTQDPDKVGIDYTDYTNSLFSGKTEVKNGEFEISFVAPKDILYADEQGKMSFYAIDNDNERKAQGSFYNYTVGGTNINRPEENNPPVISKMYLNTDKFKSGDYVNSTPMFYAEVSDDTGINLSSAIGHTMSLVIDGITVYDLAPYFQNEDNSNKKGSVTYWLPQLTEGKHTLEFTVWDVWNNSASETIDFVVTDDFTPSIYSFDIWGNPAKEYTRFVISTNTPGSNVDVTFRVYSLTGALLWTTEQNGAANTLSRYIYNWDLNTNTSGRLLPGIYICTAQINIDGRRSSVKAAKLMVTEHN